VVIGGGFGGATCAKYLRRADPTIEVTLVAPHRQFVTCPFSNAVLAGLRDMASITHGYEALRQRHGIRLIQATATAIDPTARRAMLDDGSALAYDRLVLSPGVEVRWGAIAGYDVAASEVFPHAWEAGPQTIVLRPPSPPGRRRGSSPRGSGRRRCPPPPARRRGARTGARR